jgi:hypothetical protein
VAAIGLALLVVAVGPAVPCPVVQNNETPAGPTPVYDVRLGKRNVDGLVVVAGGGGMSAVDVTSAGTAQSSGVSGGQGAVNTSINASGTVRFQTALATTTGSITQTASGQIRVIPIPTASVAFERGEVYPVSASGQQQAGRYITPPTGSAPGEATFTGVTDVVMASGTSAESIRVLEPTASPTISRLQIFGSGTVNGANGQIRGGMPVSGAPASEIPAGPPLPDANVRYDE